MSPPNSGSAGGDDDTRKRAPQPIRAYGDRMGDGAVQLSFTLPVAASARAKEAARRYAEGLGLKHVLVTESPGGDPFATVIAGGVDTNWAAAGGTYVWDYWSSDYLVAVPRGVSGAGTAVRGATHCDLNMGFLKDLPNPITRAIPTGRVLYHDTTASFPRASFPGVQFGPCPSAEKLIDVHAILDMPRWAVVCLDVLLVDGERKLRSEGGAY